MEYTHGQLQELTREQMAQLLKKARYGRLALSFEYEPYAVPISHIYDGERIWFHIAAEGKKTTYLQANPLACFQVDEWVESGWGSVICYGNVTLSRDLAIRKQFMLLATGVEPSDAQLQQANMYVCVMHVHEMTGRRSPGYIVATAVRDATPAAKADGDSNPH